jgi:hypothetical protein
VKVFWSMRLFRFATFAAGMAIVMACGAAWAGDRDARDVHRELNYEYAKLYKTVSGMRMLDELLLIKFESDETEALIKQIAAFGSRAKAELEDLKKADPSISFDEDGRTQLAHESSKLQKKERLKAYAPVTGASGADFERMLLISEAGVLSQLRFRVEVMAQADTNPARSKYLRKMHGELNRLYVRTSKLLDTRYFREGANTPLGSAAEGK